MGWPKQALHSEEFIAPGTGLPFTVELAASGKTITVGTTQSRCWRRWRPPGWMRPTCAAAGPAGNAKRPSQMRRHHPAPRPLADPRRTGRGQKIMPCVSRFEGKTLVIDR
jgi:hypothetical protein